MVRNNKKILVAMSGGVDSSVAAALLRGEGYEVEGAHMLCWDGCENNGDKQDAMAVAAKLGIRFHTFDFRKEYKTMVYEYMVREYESGRTPNPDVMCNKTIKFGIFLDRALAMGFDYIATGHYVLAERSESTQTGGPGFFSAEKTLKPRTVVLRTSTSPSGFVTLRSAKDQSKDQSYFLWTLTQNQLAHSLFPIGGYLKSEVREIARKFDLPTAAKKDSQGLCFVGKVDFGEFLREALPKKHGEVVDSHGKKIGEHDGAHFYTLGQRHGLNIGGNAQPLYVAERNITTNILVVARGDQDPVLYKKNLIADNFNWLSNEPNFPRKCFARIRYRQSLQKCELAQNGGVIFEIPQRAVAPGQSIVFYSMEERNLPAACLTGRQGRQVLGGGIIKQ